MENSLDKLQAGSPDLSDPEQMWRKFRNPENPLHKQVVPFTIKWLLRLPVRLRPLLLASQYPRLANMLAIAWAVPEQREAVLLDLLWDKRGCRKGFPQPVYRELRALYEYASQKTAITDYVLDGEAQSQGSAQN